ncbi:hypothetical protein LZ32DRAFT_597640 [Colletotrichum eremochloae]|nr:hypothetical protein LZ32DRAFT_597640 [Colletotrichum eremochloae]
MQSIISLLAAIAPALTVLVLIISFLLQDSLQFLASPSCVYLRPPSPNGLYYLGHSRSLPARSPTLNPAQRSGGSNTRANKDEGFTFSKS